jgi:hypothetical protein
LLDLNHDQNYQGGTQCKPLLPPPLQYLQDIGCTTLQPLARKIQQSSCGTVL